MAYKELLFYATDNEVKKLFEELSRQYPMDFICDHTTYDTTPREMISKKQFPLIYDGDNSTEKEQYLKEMFRKYSSITQIPSLNLYDEFSKYNTESNPKSRCMFFKPILKGEPLIISEWTYADGKTEYGISLKDKNAIMMSICYNHPDSSAQIIYPHSFTIWQTKTNMQESLSIYQSLKSILECNYPQKKENKDIVYFSPEIIDEFQVTDLNY